MSIRSDVSELINKEKTILKQITDPLTGLPNRIKLGEDIESTHSEKKLAIIHIDDLIKVTDFYGENYTKELIVKIASIFKKLFETKYLRLYKIANDEFAIFMDNTVLSLNDFINVCEAIQTYFVHNSFAVSKDELDVSVTIGIANSKRNIYVNAERALIHANEIGEALICYDSTINIEQNFKNNRIWVGKIKKAIQSDRIAVFIQPIFPNDNQRNNKYECLIRLIEENGTIVSPFSFLEIAKDSRLYSTLTRIVIEKSFKYFSGKESSFSINLTINDIECKDTINFLIDSIHKYNVAEQLILEIVESEGIENFENVSVFIEEMQDLGCRIAIDDFGTGYSNFEYLMKINTDFIKIDGSLIKNIDTDESSQIVVGLIIAFAKQLHIKTIAEHVHNIDVYHKVKELGIDYSQGYHLGIPRAIVSDEKEQKKHEGEPR